MADLDYVKVVGRLGITRGDGPDAGDDPDTVWCDEGSVIFEPVIPEMKVVGGTGGPFTVGNAAITATVDTQGWVTFNGQPFVWLLDLGSDKVNPRVDAEKATYKVSFSGVKCQGAKVSFTAFSFRPIPGQDNDLTLLSPVPATGGTPIVQGPQGVSVVDAEVAAGDLLLTLDDPDGTVVNAGALPVGPGGSDAGVASYLADAGSATYAAADTATTALASTEGTALHGSLTAAIDTRIERNGVHVDQLIDSGFYSDDTSAWEAALLSDRTVYALRDGDYSIERQLEVTANHRIVGRGGKTATRLVATDDFTGAAVLHVNGDHATIEHLTVNADAAPGVDPVRIDGGYEIVCEHVKTIGGAYGFNLNTAGLEARLLFCSALNSASHGFRANNVADIFLLDCSSDGAGGSGFYFLGGSVTAVHCHAIKSAGTGLSLIGCSSSQFYGCHADTNAQHGYYIYGVENLRMTDCWSFKNGSAGGDYGVPNAGQWANWFISGGDGGVLNASLDGCSSNNENNVTYSWQFGQGAGGIASLTLVAPSATTKAPVGLTSSITLVNPTGALAKYGNVRRAAQANVVPASGGTATFTYDLGYTPNIAFNVMTYQLTFTVRPATTKKLVHGKVFWAETNDTTSGGVSAKSYTYGLDTDPGANWTIAASRSGSVVTFTVTNNAAETLHIGFQVESFPGAKLA